MKLFNATYYHGSGAKFDKFDFTFMSTGEGAQVHGWGVYLAQERETSERYRDSLSDDEYKTLTIDGKEFTKPYELEEYMKGLGYTHDYIESKGVTDSLLFFRVLNDLISTNDMWDAPVKDVDEFRRRLVKMNDKLKDAEGEVYQNRIIVDNMIIDFLDKHDVSISNFAQSGMLATVHVDDDCAFVKESEIMSNSPYIDNVLKVWEEYAPTFVFSYDSYDKVIAHIQDLCMNNYKDYPSNYDLTQFVLKIVRLYGVDETEMSRVLKQYIPENEELYHTIYNYLCNVNEKRRYFEKQPFRDIYRKMCVSALPKDVSMALLDNGVDGILYDGNTDGECLVLFNIDKCKITAQE